MESFITTISFDVELSEAERATLYRILAGNRVRLSILPVATLLVKVRVEALPKKSGTLPRAAPAAKPKGG